MLTHKGIYEQIAGHYFSSDLPQDFFSMPEDERIGWVEDNMWEPLQDWNPEFTLETINTQYQSWVSHLSYNQVEITGSPICGM
jgi:hypothetical protein